MNTHSTQLKSQRYRMLSIMVAAILVLAGCSSSTESPDGDEMPVWFEGTGEIGASIQQVRDSFSDLGKIYVGVTALMPGLTSVDLVDQGSDFVTIRTNEGLMRRTNIAIQSDDRKVTVEFDEVYEAGPVTATTHFLDEFTSTDSGVSHRSVIRGVEAPGFLGFFYRTFGSSSTGKAVLNSFKTYFEGPSE